MEAELLSIARGRLCKCAPALAFLFNRLKPVKRERHAAPATDGVSFFYDPEWLYADFQTGGSGASAAIAHCTAHCLLGHVFEGVTDALAADMAAALFVDAHLPDFCLPRQAGLFREAKRRLAGVELMDLSRAMAEDDFFENNRQALLALLYVDDHALWRPETTASRLLSGNGAGEGWRKAARRYSGAGASDRAGQGTAAQRRRVCISKVSQRAYGDLLRRFVVTREISQEDPDTFQYAWYAYGLAHYGNMPLIEPAETREACRLEELAIVIDTSGSCVRDLTVRFLEETRAILAEERLFFPHFNLHILQCDAKVQRDDKITSLRDFERYIDTLEIAGGGGTDFCPAFEHIDQLIDRGEFRALKGVLFFSDGRGIFPTSRPPYETVFIFFRHRYDAIDVPEWVQMRVLDVPAPAMLSKDGGNEF